MDHFSYAVVVLMLGICLLVACSPENEWSTATHAANVFPTATSSLSPVLTTTPEPETPTDTVPTKISILRETKLAETESYATVLALTPSPSAILKQTRSPTPTITKTPLPGNPKSSVDIVLPTWVHQSDNLILLPLENTDGNKLNIRLFNPETGEKIDLDIGQKFYHYYWDDPNTIVFLQGTYCGEPITGVSVLDFSRRTLLHYNAADFPGLVRECSAVPEQQIAYQEYDEPERSIVLKNPATGSEVQLTNPNDGITDVLFRISPNKRHIAISQVTGEYEPYYYEIMSPFGGNQISIYQISNQELLMTVTEETKLAFMEFYPDSDKLVYLRDKTPCIILISSGQKKCIHNIPQQFPESSIYLGEPTSNSAIMGFMYTDPSWDHGGLCFYDLVSADINCPTDHFDALDEFKIMNYSLSYDDEYILFIYDVKGCPWCDIALNPHVGVMDIAGKKMYEIGDSQEIELISMWILSDLSYVWQPLESAE